MRRKGRSEHPARGAQKTFEGSLRFPKKNGFLRAMLNRLAGKCLSKKEENMVIHPVVNPVAALVAGIIVLIFPAILNYVVAFYLILVGLIGLFGTAAM
jgi:hypothetical protein